MKKINKISVLRFVFLFILSFTTHVTNSHAIAEPLFENPPKLMTLESLDVERSAVIENQHNEALKFVRVKIIELKDNRGLRYIGGEISAADLAPYLEQLKSILHDDFVTFRQNQATRDHQSFHVTLINPIEYQTISNKKNNVELKLGKYLNIVLHGIGSAEQQEKTTYYVIAQSPEAQFYRQQLVLPNKDLHITLGFDPQDVYGVNKGLDTLIN